MDWYTPQVIVSGSFRNQVVNVHVVDLSDAMHPIFCLNKNLQGEGKEKASSHECETIYSCIQPKLLLCTDSFVKKKDNF